MEPSVHPALEISGAPKPRWLMEARKMIVANKDEGASTLRIAVLGVVGNEVTRLSEEVKARKG